MLILRESVGEYFGGADVGAVLFPHYILYSSAGGAHTPRHKNSPENSRFSKKESKEETGIERQSIGTNATSIIVSPKIQHG